MGRKIEIFFGSACTGNPGNMGIGLLVMVNGEVVRTVSKPVGRGTRQIAEWMAFVEAARAAREIFQQGDICIIYGNSTLVVNKYNGAWKVGPKFKPFKEQARELLEGLPVEVKRIPRRENRAANYLAKQAAPPDPFPVHISPSTALKERRFLVGTSDRAVPEGA